MSDRQDKGADTARQTVASASKGEIAVSPHGTLRQLVEQAEGEIGRALPMQMDKERFVRLVLTELRINPKLLECSPQSVMGAVLTTAQLGLEFGTQLGQAYMIPFKNHGVMEVQLIIGFKGWLNLIDRNREIASVSVREVHERDTFKYAYGTADYITHEVNPGERGPVVGYYCIIKKVNGGYQFEVMTVDEVKVHMRRFAKSKERGPWVDNFDEMAKKTVFLKAKKWLPVTADVALASQTDTMVVHQMTSDEDPVVDFDEDGIFEGEIVNTETGEVVLNEGETVHEDGGANW